MLLQDNIQKLIVFAHFTFLTIQDILTTFFFTVIPILKKNTKEHKIMYSVKNSQTFLQLAEIIIL